MAHIPSRKLAESCRRPLRCFDARADIVMVVLALDAPHAYRDKDRDRLKGRPVGY